MKILSDFSSTAVLLLQIVPSVISFTQNGLRNDIIHISAQRKGITKQFLSHSSYDKHPIRLKSTRSDINPISNDNLEEKSKILPYVDLIDPETGCKVVLIGCLHGSSSSAEDVTNILNQEDTDSVVLELCASRFADIRRTMVIEMENEVYGNSKSNNILQKNEFKSYIDMVYKTTRKLGFSSGVAAALLGGASNIQTALSGFEPGSEFLRAISYAKSVEGCDIILADREVGETLKRFGNVPQVAANLVLSLFGLHTDRGIFGFNMTEIPYYSKSFTTAIFGSDEITQIKKSYQVKMGKVLIRDTSAMKDLILLTVPPLFAISAVFLTLNALLDQALSLGLYELGLGLDSQVDSYTIGTPSLFMLLEDFALQLITSAAILLVGYTFLALPVIKVIIHERDDQLARGISRACQEVIKNRRDVQSDRRGRVVAVLGLLHVNGVAERLLLREK